jgi:DNA repair protein SbcC/Rad50
MIPQRLTLRNFLSYREATLNFQGLHTACICGANGAGKSSLLEAIAWALWGQSRAAMEDDVIHMGTSEALVDFVFVSHRQVYRIIRSRTRGQGMLLELQVAVGLPEEKGHGGSAEEWTFRSITGKGVRATQQLIVEHIKLDYETFVNSAYLRQGRADEFMVKRPGDRKQVLADLLKLSQYDLLAERAKEQARQIKSQMDGMEQQLVSLQTQLQPHAKTVQEQVELEATIAEIQAQMERDRQHLHHLQQQQQQRQIWEKQLNWQQQQHQNLHHDCQRLRQDMATLQQQLDSLETRLNQADAIAAGYAHLQDLHRQEEDLSTRCQADQTLQTQRQQYQQRQAEHITALQTQRQQLQMELAGLRQQEAEIQEILQKSTDVAAALQELHTARITLNHLDQLQTQVAPLLQRQQQIQTQLDRTTARLAARLEELQSTAQGLEAQQARHPQLTEAAQEVCDRLEALDKQRIYQQRVREKGLERRSFMERLQVHQREYETQLGQLDQKLQWLRQGLEHCDAGHTDEISDETGMAAAPEEWVFNAADFPETASPSADVPEATYPEATYPEVGSPEATAVAHLPVTLRPALMAAIAYPACPLCDRPLDEHHWHLVLDKHRLEQQEILDQLWVVREQLAVSEREIQILRQEYWELEQELAQFGTMLERRGQLQEQLQVTTGVQTALQQTRSEIAKLEYTLQAQEFDPELREELRLLEQSLQRLNYDDRNHALARGLVDRWRWAEIKQAEIKQAQRRQAALEQRIPDLQAQIAQMDQQLQQWHAETDAQLAEFDRHRARIGYHVDRHQALRVTMRQAQIWQLRYQELEQAQRQYPQEKQRLQQIIQTLQERHHQFQQSETQLAELLKQLQTVPDGQTALPALAQSLQQRRSHLDGQLASLGRLQQQQQQFHTLNMQQAVLEKQLAAARHQHRIYQELTIAFGKNGIQTLMIENVLPELESETNQILSRLSNNQLHIQFITQRVNTRGNLRAQKSKSAAPSTSPKPIETLDILIADANGTRPYETYSGGEAFRVNFAIRLALSKLLARQSGTALQLLIIDEGFGTQDTEGCDRLIAAINAIAADFACILTVTHVPHFREAFQSRIEVFKTDAGSQLSLSI